MISLIEALRYRSLRYVRQPLSNFHVLVGPNASGKSTFLDVLAFLGRLVSDGVEAAVSERTDNFQDLVWGREENDFQLAIEVELPELVRDAVPDAFYDTIRYEVAIGVSRGDAAEEGEVEILREDVYLKRRASIDSSLRENFPESSVRRSSILNEPTSLHDWRSVVHRNTYGDYVVASELDATSPPSVYVFKPAPRKAAFGRIGLDEQEVPAAAWLKEALAEGVQPVLLNSERLRRPSPPNKGSRFRPDGSNLPHVVAALTKQPQRFKQWIAHLRTALPDLKTVKTILRPEDRHRYLMLEYDTGLTVPSWTVSDGTLRMMALTLPAYLPEFKGVYLIEEPENGIHPRAVETVYQSLSSVYNAQILTASHSPVVLSCAPASSILCFAKAADGSTDVVRGDLHPQLQHWRGETNLGDLFAAGVLG